MSIELIGYEEYNRNRRIVEDVTAMDNTEDAVNNTDALNNLQYFNTNKAKLDNLLKTNDDKSEEKAQPIINSNPLMAIYWQLIKVNKNQADAKTKAETGDPADKDLSTEELNHYTERAKELQDKLNQELKAIPNK